MKNHRDPACARPLREARERLGVEPGANAADLKRAYRRATAAHPPDRDPEGFQKVREAYELLSDPSDRTTEILVRPEPFSPPPRLREAEPITEAEVATRLVEAWAAQLDPTAFLEEPK